MLPRKQKKIVFLFPALNEEQGISKTIKEIPLSQLRKEGYICEVAVIDGRSTDRTVELAQEAGARVILSPKRGYGFQYLYGLSNIEGDYVITGDADGTYPFNEALRLVRMLEEENLDFITTNRFADLREGSMSFTHYIGNLILTITGNVLFGLRIKDNQSGMWCFKLAEIRKLGTANQDMAFSEEIKIRAFKKLRSKEVPISYHPRIGISKLNYSHAFKNFFFLFKLRLAL